MSARPQIHTIPAGQHWDDKPEIHYLEPREGNKGETVFVAHGEPAQKMLNSGMDLGALRPYYALNEKTNRYVPGCNINGKFALTNNATLRQDEWKQIDQTVLDVSRKEMAFYQSVRSAGLTMPLGNALGTTVFGWDKMSPGEARARITMEPDIPPEEDRVTYDREYIPIPLVTAGFRLNVRELDASRRGNRPLDTTIAAERTRMVNQTIEELLLNGTGGITYGGGSLYGATNYTYNVTGSLTAAWTASGRDPVTDLTNMQQASRDIYHRGPWRVFVPAGYTKVMGLDYTTGYPKSIMTRLMELEGISSIQILDYLAANKVLMMEMDQRSYRVLVGFEPRTVEWTTMGGWSFHYMIVACIVPNPRADANNRTGIIYYSA